MYLYYLLYKTYNLLLYIGSFDFMAHRWTADDDKNWFQQSDANTYVTRMTLAVPRSVGHPT